MTFASEDDRKFYDHMLARLAGFWPDLTAGERADFDRFFEYNDGVVTLRTIDLDLDSPAAGFPAAKVTMPTLTLSTSKPKVVKAFLVLCHYEYNNRKETG